MAAARLLATFLHVTDLHIGEIDPATHDAKVSQPLAWAFRHMTWLDGLLGHHGQALEELQAFCEVELFDKGESPILLATGDLTRTGADIELVLSKAFLEDEIDLSPPNQLMSGLHFGRDRVWLAGNHDQWGGASPPHGGAGSLAAAHLNPAKPDVLCPAVSLANGRDVVFVRINSDADVAPRSLNRTLARGDFVQQLIEKAAIPPTRPGKNDIRIMLIHHSWWKSGLLLSMTASSRRQLGRFLDDHRIRAILTGHTHGPILAPFEPVVGRRHVVELRSGTTTQVDQVPPSWLTMLGTVPLRPKWPQNTLLVHRLRDDPNDPTGAVVWETKTYRRSDKIGFVEVNLPQARYNFVV